jgi:PAS domain S-box-containing protein
VEEAILILAPRGRDAEVIRRIAVAQNSQAQVCEDIAALVEALQCGAALAVVTEEALIGTDVAPLTQWLDQQPSWSDFPIILLELRKTGKPNPRRLSGELGNVVVLERPINAETLMSAMDSALRARRRQYHARGELSLREQAEERLRLALNAGRLGAWELELAMMKFDASPACKRNFGRDTKIEFTYQQLLDAVHPDDRGHHACAIGKAIHDCSDVDIEYRNMWPDGSEHWIQIRGQTVPDISGHAVRMTGVSLDVTDRRRAEHELRFSQDALRKLNETLETRIADRTMDLARANDRLLKEIAERERVQAALLQAQKMEAVGHLTGGIAHDFNNLLTAIVGNVDMIGRRSDDEKIRRLAQYAREAANRATKLTGQLLAFSRTQRLDLKSIDLDALIAGMSDLIARAIGPSIEFSALLDSAPLRARADANQLELAILNLAINAKDAMPNGGRLTIETHTRRSNGIDLPGGHYLVIAVSDSGCGIDPKVLNKVFDPFFTTKPIGKGTGLGLSQVYGIAQQSGGTARIESKANEGTTVEIWLPISQAVNYASPEVVQDEAVSYTGRERILVVEDDVDVRRFVVECLRTLGYEVLDAENGRAGLDLMDGVQPDLMIVDFAMPGMNGAEMVREARSKHPDLPVVMATGYADMNAVEKVIDPEFLLRKPFQVSDLASIVRSALTEKPADRPAA